ncbi:MAG: hypothetical protein NTX64_18030 [Elusimicrobia bacterium]|nr:hypothetical protein [Elusimicrobiota bacterium]
MKVEEAMETLKIWLEKEKAVHVIIAGLLVAMALVIGVVPNPSRDAAKTAPSAFPPRTDLRDALAPIAGLPASAARFAAARPLAAIEKPVTLDEFFGLLEKSAPASTAQKFKQEFLAQPVLRKELEDFRKEQGGTAAAHEFVQRIVRLPEFRDMLGKFKAEGVCLRWRRRPTELRGRLRCPRRLDRSPRPRWPRRPPARRSRRAPSAAR